MERLKNNSSDQAGPGMSINVKGGGGRTRPKKKNRSERLAIQLSRIEGAES